MAHSVESRLPLLTTSLVDFALGLPDSFILDDDCVTKRVLRQATAGLVHPAVLERRDKVGFATPQTKWLMDGGARVDELLGAVDAALVPMINLRTLRANWRRELANDPGQAFVLWRLLSSALWLQTTKGTA